MDLTLETKRESKDNKAETALVSQKPNAFLKTEKEFEYPDTVRLPRTIQWVGSNVHCFSSEPTGILFDQLIHYKTHFQLVSMKCHHPGCGSFFYGPKENGFVFKNRILYKEEKVTKDFIQLYSQPRCGKHMYSTFLCCQCKKNAKWSFNQQNYCRFHLYQFCYSNSTPVTNIESIFMNISINFHDGGLISLEQLGYDAAQLDRLCRRYLRYSKRKTKELKQDSTEADFVEVSKKLSETKMNYDCKLQLLMKPIYQYPLYLGLKIQIQQLEKPDQCRMYLQFLSDLNEEFQYQCVSNSNSASSWNSLKRKSPSSSNPYITTLESIRLTEEKDEIDTFERSTQSITPPSCPASPCPETVFPMTTDHELKASFSNPEWGF